MKKQKMSINKTCSSNSHSVIFSDLSKIHYREQALHRKLKHLHETNSSLEQQIRKQQEQIKDERTVIIYQMGQLVKAVGNKMGVTEEYRIERQMFKDEETAQDTIQKLISKYEAIEKEEKMFIKVRNNLQKMHQVYLQHKSSLKKILDDSCQAHRNHEERIRDLIYQKRNEYEKVFQENRHKQQQIHKMQQQMIKFDEQSRTLKEEQKDLLKQIQIQKNRIRQKEKVVEEMNRWEEIIIDKKHRNQLYQKLSNSCRALQTLSNQNQELSIRLEEENMLSIQLMKMKKCSPENDDQQS